jgi:aminoglycoside 6'-N-acetyltransferase I
VEGDLAGFIYGSIAEQSEVFLHPKKGLVQGLYVEPKHRREGIGGNLVKNLLDWFRENGIQEITCTVSAGNDISLRLFRRFDFKDDRSVLRLNI